MNWEIMTPWESFNFKKREVVMMDQASSMIDHVSISVKDSIKGFEFYDATLKILGYDRLMTFESPVENAKVAGYGKGSKPSFWINTRGQEGEEIGKARGVHIAFAAPDVESINAWYNKCLELGGSDNGAPGPRPHYHPGYYGAFIIDPNGWRIEACLHHYAG